jgi:hypothetical protein
MRANEAVSSGKKHPSLSGKLDPLRVPAKKLNTKLFLKQLDMAADRSLAYVQFMRRLGEALVASGGLEGMERVQ